MFLPQAVRSYGSDDERYTSRDLAGLKVRHDLQDLGEGEGVILTLADKRLLDDNGELADDDDELENVLKVNSGGAGVLDHGSAPFRFF